MALATYTDLQASIASWLFNRTSLSALAPDFIRLAEAQMDRQVRHRLMTTTTASFALSGGELTDLPSDFRGIVSVANSLRVLDFLTQDQMAQERITNTATAPARYSIQGTKLQVWPAPAITDTVRLVYLAAIPALASNSTNWLLTRWPDAYLFGSLLQAAPFLGEDDRIPVWGTLFAKALADIQASNLTEQMGALTVRNPLVV